MKHRWRQLGELLTLSWDGSYNLANGWKTVLAGEIQQHGSKNTFVFWKGSHHTLLHFQLTNLSADIQGT